MKSCGFCEWFIEFCGISGWECLSAFYAPVSLILMVNVMFYWTAQRRISRQMSYNRNMQHFQVK